VRGREAGRSRADDGDALAARGLEAAAREGAHERAISSTSAHTDGDQARTASRTASGARASAPYRSQTKRLRARMAIGRSTPMNAPSASTRGTLPRRHAASQGAPQIRPQMDAKGFGPRAMR